MNSVGSMTRSKLPAWPSENASEPAPSWYVDVVFRNALRRVVCVLNSRVPFTGCAKIKLSGSDDAVAAAFEKAGLDADLIQFNVEGYDQFARTDEHHAEHHFYANVGFERRQARRVAVFKVPRIFLDWGYTRTCDVRWSMRSLRRTSRAGKLSPLMSCIAPPTISSRISGTTSSTPSFRGSTRLITAASAA